MKKILSFILLLIFALSGTVFAYEDWTESQYTVYIDEIYTEVENLTIDGVEMLPLKQMCSLLGYNLIEETGGRVTITEGENCKNDGSAKIEFTIGDTYITHTSKSDYVNKTETFPKKPMTIKHGEEIYITPYYFCRVFGTRLRYTGDKKIAIETTAFQNERVRKSINYNGHLYVNNHDGKLQIELDGKTLEFTNQPFIDEEGRTQIPVREFCENIGRTVNWFEENKQVSVGAAKGAGGDSYHFIIGESRYRKNGTYYDMDTAAQIIDGTTYIPLRYLAEAARYYIAYNPTSPTLIFVGYGYRTLNSYIGMYSEEICQGVFSFFIKFFQYVG